MRNSSSAPHRTRARYILRAKGRLAALCTNGGPLRTTEVSPTTGSGYLCTERPSGMGRCSPRSDHWFRIWRLDHLVRLTGLMRFGEQSKQASTRVVSRSGQAPGARAVPVATQGEDARKAPARAVLWLSTKRGASRRRISRNFRSQRSTAHHTDQRPNLDVETRTASQVNDFVAGDQAGTWRPPPSNEKLTRRTCRRDLAQLICFL
jgi:hypothetical protein